MPGQTGVVVLDTQSYPELEAEGLARDVLRVIQQGRRDAGLNVSDRIHLSIASSAEVVSALETHRVWLEEAALAVTLELSVSDVAPDGEAWKSVEIGDDTEVAFRLHRAADAPTGGS